MVNVVCPPPAPAPAPSRDACFADVPGGCRICCSGGFNGAYSAATENGAAGDDAMFDFDQTDKAYDVMRIASAEGILDLGFDLTIARVRFSPTPPRTPRVPCSLERPC